MLQTELCREIKTNLNLTGFARRWKCFSTDHFCLKNHKKTNMPVYLSWRCSWWRTTLCFKDSTQRSISRKYGNDSLWNGLFLVFRGYLFLILPSLMPPYYVPINFNAFNQSCLGYKLCWNFPPIVEPSFKIWKIIFFLWFIKKLFCFFFFEIYL